MSEWTQEVLDSRIKELTNFATGKRCDKCRGKMSVIGWDTDKGQAEIHCGGCKAIFIFTKTGLDAMFGGNPFADERVI